MRNQDYTAKILNFEDVIITEVNCTEDQLHISIELPRREHVCPRCGAVADRVHDYRMQTIKDVPWGGAPACIGVLSATVFGVIQVIVTFWWMPDLFHALLEVFVNFKISIFFVEILNQI